MSMNKERVLGQEVAVTELFFHGAVIAAGAQVIGANAPSLWIIDPGAAVNVDMPAEADVEGKVFWLVNIGAATEDITVRNDAAGTIDVIEDGGSRIIAVIGGVWRTLGQFTGP